MGDFFSIFDKINANWREWKSIPYAFSGLTALYLTLAFKFNALKNSESFLFLALLFLGILLTYTFVCALHVNFEKEKSASVASEEEKEETNKPVKSGKTRLYIAGICVSLLIVIISSYLLIMSATDKDGKYVIWADEYHVALTHNVHKSYYLSGDEVVVRGEKLEDYPRDSIFYLDFKSGDTFTIAYGDKLLGVTPGQNGVGYSDACTSVLWKLEEVEEGLYYIVNVDEETYLKWYDNLGNWTTHKIITEENNDQYLLCMEKVK